MPEHFRMFISLPVPEAVKEELRRLQNEFRAQLPEDAVRWTRPEQVHLTLKFLGNVPVEQVEELAGAMRAACRDFRPIAVCAEKVGFFPSRGVPRVIWVSVRDEREELLELQRAVEAAATRILAGVEEERFTGHLTIGRAKNLRPAHGRKLMEFASGFRERVFGDWHADVLEVMRSELSSEGSRHSCVAAIPLRARQ